MFSVAGTSKQNTSFRPVTQLNAHVVACEGLDASLNSHLSFAYLALESADHQLCQVTLKS